MCIQLVSNDVGSLTITEKFGGSPQGYGTTILRDVLAAHKLNFQSFLPNTLNIFACGAILSTLPKT